jgi:hydroxymethylglutaryl-CoA lyase
MLRDVEVYEVGPRDGLQSVRDSRGRPIILDTDTKVEYIDLLTKSRLPSIEIGSFVSTFSVPSMADTFDVAWKIQHGPAVRYCALVPTERQYERFIPSSLSELSVVVSAHEDHNRSNLRCGISKTLEKMSKVIGRAINDVVQVRGYISVAFGYTEPKDTPVEDVIGLIKWMFDQGVYQVSLGDTTAMATPKSLALHLAQMRDEVDISRVALHLHHRKGDDPRPLIDMALEMGIRTFDSATGGIGGCPTNPDLQNVDTLSLVQHLERNGLHTGIDIDQIVEAQRHIEYALHLDTC